jgi:hypothetical protein
MSFSYRNIAMRILSLWRRHFISAFLYSFVIDLCRVKQGIVMSIRRSSRIDTLNKVRLCIGASLYANVYVLKYISSKTILINLLNAPKNCSHICIILLVSGIFRPNFQVPYISYRSLRFLLFHITWHKTVYLEDITCYGR